MNIQINTHIYTERERERDRGIGREGIVFRGLSISIWDCIGLDERSESPASGTMLLL